MRNVCDEISVFQILNLEKILPLITLFLPQRLHTLDTPTLVL